MATNAGVASKVLSGYNVSDGRISTSSDATIKTNTTDKTSSSTSSSTSTTVLTSRTRSHGQTSDSNQKQCHSPSFPHNLRRPSDPKLNGLVRALIAVLLGVIKLPLWMVYYAPRLSRPHPQWTWRQAVLVRILKYYIYHVAMLEKATRLSLSQGLEGNRFVVMQQAKREMYVGVAAASKGFDAKGRPDEVAPGLVGGTWYPAPLVGPSGTHSGSAGQGTMNVIAIETTGPVALHFHGGAYVLGAGRTMDAGFGARLLLKHAGVSHVLCPQYRLAGSSNYDNQSSSSSSSSSSLLPPGRFPAALQDAITSYIYLTTTLKLKPHQIVLSGDSAGGNLVLALLRYITDHGPTIGLEPPSCAWLWSPWVDIANSFDVPAIDASLNHATDILAGNLLAWGASAFCGGNNDSNGSSSRGGVMAQLQLDPKDPYISPLHHPFPTKTPVWVQTGGAEVFCLDNVRLAEQMNSVKGNHVELWVESKAIHDICLLGMLTGFGEEATSAANRAKDFMHSRKIKG